MTILETNGREGVPDGFSELAARVYAGDPHRIPENPVAIERAFSSANPWFEDGEALCLLAPGSARLVAFRRPSMVVDGRPVAYFGYWETLGDGADPELFRRATSWAREQGAVELYGPINFSTFGDYRLRLSAEPGGETFPAEPYNPSSYPRILEQLGFDVVQEYIVQVGTREAAAILKEHLRPIWENVRRQGYRLEPFDGDVWMDNLQVLHRLVDLTFSRGFGYTPLPYEAFVSACGESFAAKACPVTSTLCWGPDGDLVGFSLLFPHYGPLVVQGAGRDRVAVDDLRYSEHFPKLRGDIGAIYKTAGVAPAHQKRGLLKACGFHAIDRGNDTYAAWFPAMMRSDNPSRRVSERVIDRYRYYALYRAGVP